MTATGGSARTEIGAKAFVGGLALGLGLACALFALDMFARGRLAVGFAGHVAASFVVALVVAGGGGSRQARLRRSLCSFAVSVCIPGVGAIGVALVLVSIWTGVREDDMAVEEDALAETSAVAHGRESPALASAPVRSRVAVLLSQRSDSSRASVRALRRALRHPEEEVRLLAHALLERHESRIRRQIASAQQGLAVAGEAHERFQLLRRLAHLHWALVERELVPQELTTETLTRASQFACDAFALRASDELSLLRARIASRLRVRRSP